MSGSEQSANSTTRSSDGVVEFSLIIHGSRAPCCAPRPLRPPPRRRSIQPPNSPSRPHLLPIDRIKEMRSQWNRTLEDGCSLLSDRSSSRSSSHPDFSLDLSSIANSPRNGKQSSTSSCDESAWSEPIVKTPYVPKNKIWNKKTTQEVEKKSVSIEASSPKSTATWTIPDSRRSKCACAKRDTADNLIGVYVDTVKNGEITKFFRPCITCGQQTCQCLDSHRCLICDQHHCICKNEEPTSNPRKASSCSTSRYSTLSQYPATPHQDRGGDSGNSTLQLNDSNREPAAFRSPSILSQRHVSLSVMQLATAAQCARILADSLESVLDLAREELRDDNLGTKPVALDSSFPQERINSALTLLDKNYSFRPNSEKGDNKPF